MTMESSDEIRRMFYSDSYSKKKIGSNVHKKASIGSERAGVSGGIIFPKYNFKPYEKNSKVKQKNVFEEVVSFEFFDSLPKDRQKELFQIYLGKFTNKEIFEGMGVSEKKFYEIRTELGLNRRNEIVKLTREEFEDFKKGNIDIYKFKMLPDDQKFEIVDHIQKTQGVSNPEMANMIGYSANSFNTLKSEWKKAFKARGRKDDSMSQFDDSFLIDLEENNRKEKIGESSEVKEVNSPPYTEKKSEFEISLNGTFTGQEIREKISALATIFNDEKIYNITFTITDK